MTSVSSPRERMTVARAPKLHHRAQHRFMPGRVRSSISCGLRDFARPCGNPIYHNGARADRGGGGTRFGWCVVAVKGIDRVLHPKLRQLGCGSVVEGCRRRCGGAGEDEATRCLCRSTTTQGNLHLLELQQHLLHRWGMLLRVMLYFSARPRFSIAHVLVSNKNKISWETDLNWPSWCIVSVSGTQSSLAVNENYAYMK
jgi:hypothetical protein